MEGRLCIYMDFISRECHHFVLHTQAAPQARHTHTHTRSEMHIYI